MITVNSADSSFTQESMTFQGKAPKTMKTLLRKEPFTLENENVRVKLKDFSKKKLYSNPEGSTEKTSKL